MKAIYDVLPYQQTLIDKMQAGGFKHSELMLFAAGRQTGKSMLNQWLPTTNPKPKFEINDKAEVDGATWYTVSCSKEVSIWLLEQSKELHYLHIDNNRYFFVTKFDIHEKLYSMMALKWS